VRNEFANIMPTSYPCVPGHEIVGRVAKIGTAVTKFKEGDLAAVGCMVDSDRTCEACREGEEQFCASQPIFTYNGPDQHLGGVTYGGYSESVVVDEDFVLRVPKNLELAATAPLLCAGITTYSPLRHANIRVGLKVGIVGLGGLGHMGVKLATALGAHVVVFTTSPQKPLMQFASVPTTLSIRGVTPRCRSTSIRLITSSTRSLRNTRSTHISIF
jgi:uncharacterized zinc-type alcohol dehydrogenase-like protein